jgi:hypothetical protein
MAMRRLSGGNNPRQHRFLLAIATASALAIAGSGGCSHQAARVAAPALDAKAAADAAIAEYDTDRDGMISGKELDRVPALKVAIGRLGKGSGKISAEAIADEIRAWQETKIALTNLGVSVTLDGQPLAGATVTAEPEKFLGPTILPASGVTDHTGSAALRIEGKPGLSFGFYKIRVSKMVAGREAIPARYNAQTELGAEVAPKVNATGGLTLNLTST